MNAYGVKAGWFIPFVDKRVDMHVKLCDPFNTCHSLEAVYDDALYKSTFTLLYFALVCFSLPYFTRCKSLTIPITNT